MSTQAETKIGFQVGQRVSSYEFLDVLESTGCEIAYKVRNHLTQRLEELKVLSADSSEDRENAERFIREIKVHAKLQHPNIVTFYNAAELDGQLVMTKELVEGITLAERLRRMGSLSWMEAVSHISQILQALSFAHERGIIHRNVTPETIILTEDATAKLNGFDLAKPIASPSLTLAGAVLGALKYIPPEQIRGVEPLDARSDLYSVGVVLYEALTGRLPFDSQSQFKVMMDHVNTEAPPPSTVNSHIPQEFDAVMKKALAKNPAHRFQTADEFRARLESLRNALRGKGGAAQPDAPAESCPPSSPIVMEPLSPAPDFGIATVAGTGRRSFLLLILGVSSLLVGVTVALLLAMAKL